jgi:hypothetical protein
VKLFVGSLFSGDRVWIKAYPRTITHWLTVRHQYRWMKVDDRELDRILSRVEEAC